MKLCGYGAKVTGVEPVLDQNAPKMAPFTSDQNFLRLDGDSGFFSKLIFNPLTGDSQSLIE